MSRSTALMPKRDESTPRIDLLQGTLDLLILQTLQWGPQHGHGIGQAIRISSKDALQIEHGSIYPALHRLESRGWLASEWKMSEASRRAKYYKLTPQGKKQMVEEQAKWKQLVRAIARTTKPIQE
jgi:PadR family transcriptional regulator PadR